MALTEAEGAELEALKRQTLIDRARAGNVLAFTALRKPDYQIEAHNRIIAKYVGKFLRKEISRLMIFAPPQHGKSELVSRGLPAHILGMYPNDHVLACSYNASLASDMCLDVERILDQPEYQEIFPKTRIIAPDSSGRFKRTASEFELIPIVDEDTEEVSFRPDGDYRCAGVEGSFSGKPGDWLIIDDPYKNRTDADSPSTRKSIANNYSSTLRTRMAGFGQILIMHTRWHTGDLAADLEKLMKADPNADQWVIVSLPAILESEVMRKTPEDKRALGEALWPGRFPLPTLRAMKALNSRDFEALYQQQPTSSEGAVIKRSMIQFYRTLPARLTRQIQSWDFTFKDTKKADFVVGQVWGELGADKYLIDQVRDRMDILATVKALQALSAKHPKALLKLFEDKANGPAIHTMLKDKVNGLVPVNPEGSKEARLYAVAPMWEAMNIWLPHPDIAPWIMDFIEEIVSFPTVPNDDQVDAMSQALDRLNNGSTNLLARLGEM